MGELGSPELTWKDNMTPQSERFGDVYFSADDGIAESLYVFVNGCGFPEGFEGKDSVTIAETGFGTGLNFLLTWQAWKESGATCRLNYVSVEAFPIEKDQLEKAYQTFPGLEEYTQEFLKHYPKIYPGFHHIILEEGRVSLTLLFGEASDMYGQFEGQVDAWYLDGFAPAKNPEMWTAELFKEIARLSKCGTVFSTFTAAGFVKRGLAEVGFEISKCKGFGRKRDSLKGKFIQDIKIIEFPWFSNNYKVKLKQCIAVVGAGIAGIVTANRLKEEGHVVEVFDRNERAGQEGSGNRLGLIKPRLIIEQNGGGLFNRASYLKAVDYYDRLESDIWIGERGLFQMYEDDADKLRQKIIFENGILPEGEMELLDASQASEKVGIDLSSGGVWYPNSGCLEPSKLCQRLASNVNCHFNQDISRVEKEGDKWCLYGAEGKLFEGDAVVFAMAGQTPVLNSYFDMHMNGRRGQVSYVKATEESKQLKHAVACKGYFLPETDGQHIVGASFDRWNDFQDLSYKDLQDESHDKNKEKLKRFLPDMEPVVEGGRANIRAMTPDHFPIVGPVFNDEVFKDMYGHLKHGPKGKTFEPAQYIDGLYVIAGLGARGVQSAPLLADILSSYISGMPSPVERAIREALHPARFLIRSIRKGRV